jgi:hypothetical protein
MDNRAYLTRIKAHHRLPAARITAVPGPANTVQFGMAGKAFMCRIGLNDYVKEHPRDERLQGPDGPEVCRRYGKRREGTPFGNLPPGGLSGGGPSW